MNAKLTLVMNPDVIATAKTYAKGHDTSVSKLVENYLSLVASSGASEQGMTVAPITRSLIGCARLSAARRAAAAGKTDKEVLVEALVEKYAP